MFGFSNTLYYEVLYQTTTQCLDLESNFPGLQNFFNF